MTIYQMTTLYLENVVCPQCMRIIEHQFGQLGLPLLAVRLGEADLARPLADEERAPLLAALDEYGFKLLEDKRAILVNQIKTALIGLIFYQQEYITTNYSTYLEQMTGRDYSSISHIFSAREHCTIARYIILLKVEYIKAHIDYDEESLGEIANRLQYSSLSHLSRQFREVTGYSPSEYMQLPVKTRIPLNHLTGANYATLIKNDIKPPR
ncbi:MAG: helix-turn-helix domain-containing protein [Adhaeribacter sp.]